MTKTSYRTMETARIASTITIIITTMTVLMRARRLTRNALPTCGQDASTDRQQTSRADICVFPEGRKGKEQVIETEKEKEKEKAVTVRALFTPVC